MRRDPGPPKLGLSSLQFRAWPQGDARRPATGSESGRRPVPGWVGASARPSQPLTLLPFQPAAPRPKAWNSHAGRARLAVPQPPAAPRWARPRHEPQVQAGKWAAAAGLHLRVPRARHLSTGPQSLPSSYPLIPDPTHPPLVCSWHQAITLSCRSLLLFPPLWLQG